VAFKFGAGGTNTLQYGATDFVNAGTTTSYSIFARFLVNTVGTTERFLVSQRGAAGIGETYFNFDSGATNELIFGINSDGGVNFYEASWVSGWLAGTTHSALGTWDGSTETLNIYADGDPSVKATSGIVGNRLAFNAPSVFAIGNKGQSGATSSWDGVIYTVAIWYRVLDTAERAILFNTNNPLFVAGPHSYWSFRMGAMDEVQFINGTITGALQAQEAPGIIPPYLPDPLPRFGSLPAAAPGGATWPGWAAASGWY
jgi:hypothetical protein